MTCTRVGTDTIEGGTTSTTYDIPPGVSVVFYEPDSGSAWEATPAA